MASSKSVTPVNLVKIFDSSGGKKVTAVDNVSLTIHPGEFVTLLGPSGCGKTTILRMVAGFETPSSGDVLIGDAKVNTLTPDKRDTAMVFQSYALFPHLNVFENVAYGLKIKKLKPDDIRVKVREILVGRALSILEGRSQPVVRRATTARRLGARSGHGAVRAFVRRAAFQFGRQTAHSHAARNPQKSSVSSASPASMSPMTKRKR